MARDVWFRCRVEPQQLAACNNGEGKGVVEPRRLRTIGNDKRHYRGQAQIGSDRVTRA